MKNLFILLTGGPYFVKLLVEIFLIKCRVHNNIFLMEARNNVEAKGFRLLVEIHMENTGSYSSAHLFGGTIDETIMNIWPQDYIWDIECDPSQVYTLDLHTRVLGVQFLGDLPNFAFVDANIISSDIPPIPAPGAILLGSIGVGMFGWLRKRKIF